MQTKFTNEQLKDPKIFEMNSILRKCVHCGFCTATCPTYLLTGDELDSPRGRIYLIKELLENNVSDNRIANKHIDRCLSCLSCMTTCPAGVDYMHLVDFTRAKLEKENRRNLIQNLIRSFISFILPYPWRFRTAIRIANLIKPFSFILPQTFQNMIQLIPKDRYKKSLINNPQTFYTKEKQKLRVAFLTGCAQQVLKPIINESTIKLLNLLGCEVVIPEKMGCCGALDHHLGKEEKSLKAAKKNIKIWYDLIKNGGLDAIITNTSGCGTTLKDYGHMLANDKNWSKKAKSISEICCDLSELLNSLNLTTTDEYKKNITIVYHSPCSMQHGQKIHEIPINLLKNAGFTVVEPIEAHICCGSAGTYNILQHEMALKLAIRKARNLKSTGAKIIATGNIGCMMQIAPHVDLPVIHYSELIYWANGGPVPKDLQNAFN